MGARLAVFSLVDWAFATVRQWAASAGHEIAIVVTLSPHDSAPILRYAPTLDPSAVFMVVPTVEACEAAVADMGVDIGIVFTFRLIPERVAQLPRHGTVNLHPSLLPAYRGANGLRSLYEGEPRLGVTLHYLTAEVDGGPILAQASEPTPEDVQPHSALDALKRTATVVLDAGVPRALAGERGEDQDESASTRAPRFADPETVLDLRLSAHLFQCRFSALNLAGIQPRVTLDGEPRPLRSVERLRGLSALAPGVVELKPRRAIVAVADAVLELELGELPF